MSLSIDFAGEIFRATEGEELTVGRGGDIEIDDNPYLHRRFLRITYSGGLWWLTNVGAQLTARVSDDNRLMEAWLAPGGRMPLAFEHMVVVFTAGSTQYELDITLDNPPTPAVDEDADLSDDGTTRGRVSLTHDQRLLVVALAEPALRRGDSSAAATLPTTAEAAERLGWTEKKFERKLDNVCDKLAKLKVGGLQGNVNRQAANRRARLADYALATGLIDRQDLSLLDS